MTEENANTEETTEQTTQTDQTTLAEGASTADDEGTLLGGDKNVVNAPEKYEFTVPEGMELDTGMVDAVSPVLKEIDISQENAQKLVDVYGKQVKVATDAAQQKAADDWTAQTEGWKTETMKQLGPTAKEDLAVSAKFINKFGTPELRKVLNETGLGNHPELVKLFVKGGKAISEDTFVEGSQTNAGAGEGGVDTNTMYPTMEKE